MPKVGLLLFGQPRFILNQISSDSHHAYIIDKYPTDVFVHAWWDKSREYHYPSSWTGLNHIIADPYAIRTIRNSYNPAHAIYDEPRFFGMDSNDDNNVKSQLCSIKEVGKVLKDYTDPTDYDFLILSRFDNKIHRFPDLNNLGKGFYKMDDHPGFADQMFIFSPEYLPFLECYDAFDELWNLNDMKSIEKLKEDYFFRRFPGHDIHKSDFFITLIRE